jgi:erythronate-4-phosphate dehydrogenase
MGRGVMKIAVDRNIPLAGSGFGALGEVTLLETTAVTPGNVRDAGALVIRSETKVGPGLLEGSAVRFVGSATIGTDHIDLPYLASREIAFASAPGSNANSVKEYVLAALLTLARRRGFRLRGKTLGVVGVGNVGSRVARVARALGMTVLENDPPLARERGGGGFLPLDALMEADIITLHVPLTRTGNDPTYHLFDARRIGAMKRGSILLNTSRGAVVETRALEDALREAHIAAAVLDVWEGEPSIDAGLLALVSLGTSHIAGYSIDGKVNAASMIRAALCRFLNNASVWDPSQEIPPPPVPSIALAEGGTTEESLGRAVKACYDIEYDDRLLRGLFDVPPEGRGRFFMGLRTGYRVRREFASMSVIPAPVDATLRSVLTDAGFRL